MRDLAAVHVVALGMALGGCERGRSSTGVSDSAFVATMSELRIIQESATLDSAGRDSARRQVLQSRGLTPEALERAARALAANPARAAELAQSIDRLSRGDTTAPVRSGAP